jgi:phosphosulfolactate phosphohydrolase-like enzyme
VIEALAGEERVVALCAGNLGKISLEDLGFAGLLCARMAARGATLDGDAARLASTIAPADAREVRALVEGSSHGRYLRRSSAAFARDVDFAAGLDRMDRAFRI